MHPLFFYVKGENIMLKRTITYTDYNGVERKEDFYFNLSKAELAEMELGTTGGYSEMVQKIIDTKDVPSLIGIFKNLVLKAYGVKSDDGRRFIKSDKLSEEFTQTEAYSILFMELANNADAAQKFINGVIPKDLADEVSKQKTNQFLSK